ncbi:hypothetical protein D3C86_1607630 [compost metagenome]
MGRNAVQRKGCLSGGEQGIAAIFRFTACMSGDAGKAHVEFGGRHKVIAATDDGTRRDAGTDVDRGKIIDAVQRSGGHHRPRPARTFFGGLEDKLNGAVQL